MSEYRDRLRAMKDAWSRGREQPEGVPAGVYEMQLQDVELTESMSSGKLMVHWTHLIVGSREQAGETVHDYQGVENERAAFFIGLRIEKLGFETPDDPGDLEEVLAAIADAAPTYMGKVTQSKEGFTNVRVQRLLDGGEIVPRRTVKKKTKTSASSGDVEGLVGQTVIYRADGEECEVVAHDGDNLTIQDANGDQYECTLADVEVQGGGDGLQDEGLSSEARPEVFSVGDRVAAEIEGETYEGEVTETDDNQVLVKFDDGDEDVFDADDLAIGEGGGDEPDEELAEWTAFCQSQEVAVEDGDTVETLTERVKTYNWDASKLTKEEIELLASIGVEARKKRAKKKTAKKTSRKKGGKKKKTGKQKR